MSLLGKIIESVVEDESVLDFSIKAIDKIEKKLEKREEKSRCKMLECAPGERALLISQRTFTKSDYFDVYDSSQNVKYSVKGEVSSIKHHLHIYDTSGREIAFLKEKLMSLRPSAVFEKHPTDFYLEINGDKVGNLKSKWAFGKSKYILDNGWNIEEIFGFKYKVTSGNKTIATISSKILSLDDTYAVTFSENEDELLMLMITLAIIIGNAPKKSQDPHYARYY